MNRDIFVLRLSLHLNHQKKVRAESVHANFKHYGRKVFSLLKYLHGALSTLRKTRTSNFKITKNIHNLLIQSNHIRRSNAQKTLTKITNERNFTLIYARVDQS